MNTIDILDINNQIQQENEIIDKLKNVGFKITKQRKTIISIILKNKCNTCKEIHFKANKIDSSIGIATVYRTLNALEEIGILNRENTLGLTCDCTVPCSDCRNCSIIMKENMNLNLSHSELKDAILQGLKIKGIDTNIIKEIIL